MNEPVILVVDDDKEIVQLIRETLEEEGYETIPAYNGKQAVEVLESKQVSLVVLDIMMPEMDGLEVCRKVRNIISIPIIVLSAKSREIDKIVGLEIGADDYITKPFSIHELVARVNAHIRREKRAITEEKNDHQIMKADDFSINKETYEVFKEGKKIELSTKEFQILVYLVENNNKVLTREQIYNAIWGYGDYGDINTVTVHIKNLRGKVDQENKYIKTVWGVGYKFAGGGL